MASVPGSVERVGWKVGHRDLRLELFAHVCPGSDRQELEIAYGMHVDWVRRATRC